MSFFKLSGSVSVLQMKLIYVQMDYSYLRDNKAFGVHEKKTGGTAQSDGLSLYFRYVSLYACIQCCALTSQTWHQNHVKKNNTAKGS
jgi:hypothetical protein